MGPLKSIASKRSLLFQGCHFSKKTPWTPVRTEAKQWLLPCLFFGRPRAPGLCVASDCARVGNAKGPSSALTESIGRGPRLDENRAATTDRGLDGMGQAGRSRKARTSARRGKAPLLSRLWKPGLCEPSLGNSITSMVPNMVFGLLGHIGFFPMTRVVTEPPGNRICPVLMVDNPPRAFGFGDHEFGGGQMQALLLDAKFKRASPSHWQAQFDRLELLEERATRAN